jgi:hypothetical protein
MVFSLVYLLAVPMESMKVCLMVIYLAEKKVVCWAVTLVELMDGLMVL